MMYSVDKRTKFNRIRSIQKQQNKSSFQQRQPRLITQIDQQVDNYYVKPPRLRTMYNYKNHKKVHSIIGKDREELLEVNLDLRKKINELERQVNKSRSKVEIEKKKNNKFTKKFEREFEKQIYWTGAQNNLILGIKSQYNKLKEDYEIKCQEISSLKKDVNYTLKKQSQAYIKELEQHIRDLRIEVENIRYLSKINTNNKSVNVQQYKEQLYPQLIKLKEKNQMFKVKINDLNAQIKSKDKKLKFLQKLIIQKNNNHHNEHLRVRKLEKQRKDFEEKINEMQQQLEKLVQRQTLQIQAIQQTFSKKFEIQHTIFQKEITHKTEKIGKLQKEVTYLSTLLSYWKPLDEHKKQSIGTEQLKSQPQVDKVDNIVVRPRNVSISSIVNQNPAQNNINRHSQKLLQQKSNNINRKPYSCSSKNSQNSIKMRKLQFREVQHLSNILKLRLIHEAVPYQNLKQYLNSQTNDAWDKQYIKMSEVKKILQLKPFILDPVNAQLLSRYIIQDSEQDFVYCDQNNETNRVIGQSIFKAFVGEYQLPNLGVTIPEWNQILQRFQNNLKLALQSIAPQGLITRSRLMELIQSLGIEMSKGCQLMILGKIMNVSENQSKMNFKAMFDKI